MGVEGYDRETGDTIPESEIILETMYLTAFGWINRMNQ